MPGLTVEIWSDIACPWCYIGKRRFETALAGFPHREQVEVVWRSFQLDPGAPRRVAGTVDAMLARKYGMSEARAAELNAQVTALAAAEGLEYHLERAQMGNTFDAHRLIHLAAAHGLQARAKERLLRAYFTDGLAVGEQETLAGLGAEIGLPADEVRALLDGDAYAAEVRADLERAEGFDIRGVPFFVINERYGVSGAQTPDVLLSALSRAWADAQPLELVAAADDASCADGSCAIQEAPADTPAAA